MVKMYTYEERESILNTLIGQLKKRDEIVAIILVGSASYGFRDIYSDIDIAIVHDGNSNIDSIFQRTLDDITSKYEIAVKFNQLERNLQIILLDKYLELDIGYYTLDSLDARREEYSVVYDRSNSVKTIMDNSWHANKSQNMGTTASVNIENELMTIDATFWYSLIHAIHAYKRNEPYRCYFELEEMRNKIISLIGKRNHLESKRFRKIHQLNDSEREKIDSLFCYPKREEELKILLLLMLDFLFSEYAYWENEGIHYEPSVNKTFLAQYICTQL